MNTGTISIISALPSTPSSYLYAFFSLQCKDKLKDEFENFEVWTWVSGAAWFLRWDIMCRVRR